MLFADPKNNPTIGVWQPRARVDQVPKVFDPAQVPWFAVQTKPRTSRVRGLTESWFPKVF
jgi:hypothetical protein